MRQLMIGDITAAARVLRGVCATRRAGLAREMIAAAHLADLWRKRTGKLHPVHGDGSLMAEALRHAPPPEPFAGEGDYLLCLRAVIDAALDWRARTVQPDAQEMQRVRVGSSSSRFAAISSPQSSQ